MAAEAAYFFLQQNDLGIGRGGGQGVGKIGSLGAGAKVLVNAFFFFSFCRS